MILYHIEFVSEKEHFEKVGITKYDVFKRFGSKSTSMYKGYQLKILELLDVPSEICRSLETEIHKEYHDYSYTPETENFSGKTECFEPNIIDLKKYKKIYNRYKNINLEVEKTTKTIKYIHYEYINEKSKIKVKKLYNKDELKYTQEQVFEGLFNRKKKPLALIQDGKLFAKQLDNGRFYKIIENEYK